MLTFRNAIAAITMAVAALCGGGKAAAEQKGTLSVSEVRAAPALRSKSHKRAEDIVTLVSTTEASASEQYEEARATDDDRAALNPILSIVRLPVAKPTTDPRTGQTVSETIRLRPPTRAPPKGAANRLADASGRA